jgi:hypothetical protein
MTLQSTISAAATSISVNTVIGLPGTAPFTLVIDPGTSLEEIVDVTAVAGTVLTITRGVDGSPAQAHTVGASVRHMAVARDFREANSHINATSGVHGVIGPLLGTTDTQAVFNKDLTSGTNTFPTSLATASQLTAHAALGSGVHGVTGSVVGTTDTQTLSNKTLASPTITGSITGNGAFSGSVTGTNVSANMPAASVTKANQRLHWGTFSGSTDASGYVTVTHGAGFTPSVVLVTMAGNSFQFSVSNITSTTYKIRVLNSSGGAQLGLDASHFFLCGE